MRKSKQLAKRCDDLERKYEELHNEVEVLSDLMLDMRRNFSEELDNAVEDRVMRRLHVQVVENREAYEKGQKLKEALDGLK